ncbi:MAG TPA: glycoside hydrolase [Lentisphaeria bacterium]|nr:MAG: hypothetical protein A2X45_21325 [Lentisphaerae bacterium GWF2_50_93]HCE45469.1 glycoside hydrolase [Lentisphaeria bacterium]
MEISNTAKEWFSRRRFGLFLHFGLYAIEGWHEQDQMRRHISRAEYGKLISKFNPTGFNADKILDLAESAGMEYVCLTTKHHDGFCLWDTKYTSFNVMNSPYGKDIVKQLADACSRRKFSLGLYYSVADWHHPGYPNQGRHHELSKPEKGDEPDWEKYMEFLKSQVKELCTNYGEVRHFFWDMNVPGYKDPSINDMMRQLQPHMVINDRGFDEGDFGTPEREYSKNETDRMVRFPRYTEACNSVGTQSWGYRNNEDYYTAEFLISSIDGIMSKGGNYLLNIGPDSRGCIPNEDREIVSSIGDWYNKVRESFGDSEPASELTANREILLTRNGNNLYVHIPSPVRAESVILAPLSNEPSSAIILNTGKTVNVKSEILPTHWQSGKKILRIMKIPRDAMTGETLVVRLQFSEPLPEAGASTALEFKG